MEQLYMYLSDTIKARQRVERQLKIMMTPIKEIRLDCMLVLSAHWTFEDLF